MTVEWKAGDLFQVKPGKYPGLLIFGVVTEVSEESIEGTIITYYTMQNQVASVTMNANWLKQDVERLEAADYVHQR